MIIFFGHVFMHKPPKSINFAYGYRTKRSTASKDAWTYAHQVCGRLWYKGGIILAILLNSLFFISITLLRPYRFDIYYVLFFTPLVFMLGSIIYTEKKLKAHEKAQI
jgi:uncharacterized membrane protein